MRQTSARGKITSADSGAFDYSNLGTFSHVVLESSTYSAELIAVEVVNYDIVAISDVISQFKRIIGSEILNTFDLVDTTGARVTEIT